MTIAEDTSRIRQHVRRVALEAAIQGRWADRRWYRSEARRMFANRWEDLAHANDRQIVRLVRQLRRVRATPMTEAENRAAWGDR